MLFNKMLGDFDNVVTVLAREQQLDEGNGFVKNDVDQPAANTDAPGEDKMNRFLADAQSLADVEQPPPVCPDICARRLIKRIKSFRRQSHASS